MRSKRSRNGTRPGALPDLDREFERARRARIRGMIAGVVALVLVVGLGGALAWSVRPGAEPSRGTSAAGRPGQGGDARVEEEPSDPPLVRPKRTPYIPAKGSGKFHRPASSGKVRGRGKLMRYMIEVEGGLKQSPEAFAESVDDILADPRGWTAGGTWAFKRVDSGSYDFVVRLASPGTVDKICGAYGMTTEGKVNCAAGKQVVVNLKRWLLLTTYYKGQPEHYHALTINHEVGHRLGFGHMTCSGRGRPAPVMQQQIFGLKGCRANGWPYDAKGRFIKGPSVR
ncbi:DUF3152 domain-containing protein [Actinomadura sp. GTD37]|uniref:DUF3152 domain-containing protein n=1 Tax=Actinomadura sp. GTD37 TaxID=1778030 RepID=UPI0035BEEBD1